MYKPLHDSTGTSKKLAGISDFSYRVWGQLYAQTDAYGRFPNEPDLIKAQALARRTCRLVQISEAVLELSRAELLHLYDVAGRQYLVYHDVDQWKIGSGRIKVDPKFPAPPSNLCRCVVNPEMLREPQGGKGRAPPSNLVLSISKEGGEVEERRKPDLEGEEVDLRNKDVREMIQLANDKTFKLDSRTRTEIEAGAEDRSVRILATLGGIQPDPAVLWRAARGIEYLVRLGGMKFGDRVVFPAAVK